MSGAAFVEGYRGADVADSIVAHSPRGTVHALRPAAEHYLVAVADDVLVVPAVTLARRLIGSTDDRDRRVVPSHLAPALVEAIQTAAEWRSVRPARADRARDQQEGADQPCLLTT